MQTLHGWFTHGTGHMDISLPECHYLNLSSDVFGVRLCSLLSAS